MSREHNQTPHFQQQGNPLPTGQQPINVSQQPVMYTMQQVHAVGTSGMILTPGSSSFSAQSQGTVSMPSLASLTPQQQQQVLQNQVNIQRMIAAGQLNPGMQMMPPFNRSMMPARYQQQQQQGQVMQIGANALHMMHSKQSIEQQAGSLGTLPKEAPLVLPQSANKLPVFVESHHGRLTQQDIPSQQSGVKRQHMTEEENEALLRKRKMQFKLPDRPYNLLPESPLFSHLQNLERMVDNIISKKRHEILEIFNTASAFSEGKLEAIGAARRTLRVYIFSQHYDQNLKMSCKGNPVPHWTLNVHGRMIEASDESHPRGGGSTAPNVHAAKVYFTQCLKMIKIEFDKESNETDAILLWEKSKHDREQRDCFQVCRTGSSPCSLKITFRIDHAVPLYEVPESMEELLDLSRGVGKGLYTVPYLMSQIWLHAKKNSLLISDGGVRKITLDNVLHQLFQEMDSFETMSFQEVHRCVKKCIKRASDPICVDYRVETNGPTPSKPVCLDIHYEAPLVGASATRQPESLLHAKEQYEYEIEELNVDLAEQYHKFNDIQAQQVILEAFSNDPYKMIREISGLQSKDIRCVPEKDKQFLDIMSSGSIYQEKWAQDAILRYLSKKQQQKRATEKILEQQAKPGSAYGTRTAPNSAAPASNTANGNAPVNGASSAANQTRMTQPPTSDPNSNSHAPT